MSKAKFTAAKELIQEKRYSEARAILQTINHPTANKWLAKLDTIELSLQSPRIPMPPPSLNLHNPSLSQEQARFYRRENRSASIDRIFNGLRAILLGIFSFAAFVFFNLPVPAEMEGYTVNTGPDLSWVFVPMGIIAILVGIYSIFRRD